MTTTEAIRRSVTHNEIVTLDYDPALAVELLVTADDHADTGLVVEYWGRDDEGDPWRVHLRRPETEIR